MTIHFKSKIYSKIILSDINQISLTTGLNRTGLYKQQNLTGKLMDCETTLKLMSYWNCQFPALWEITDQEENDRMGDIGIIDWSKDKECQFVSCFKSLGINSISSAAKKIGINPNTLSRLLKIQNFSRIHTSTLGKIMDYYSCNFGDLIKLKK